MNTEEINRKFDELKNRAKQEWSAIRKEIWQARQEALKAADEALKTPKVGDWFYAKFENNQFAIGRIKEIEDLRIKFFGLTDEGWKEDEQCYVCPKESTCNTFNIMNESGVIELLTKEAEKRYKDGDKVISVVSDVILPIKKKGITSVSDKNFLYCGVSVLDLQTGKWAEKVEPVKDEDYDVWIHQGKLMIKHDNQFIDGKYKLVKLCS